MFWLPSLLFCDAHYQFYGCKFRYGAETEFDVLLFLLITYEIPSIQSRNYSILVSVLLGEKSFERNTFVSIEQRKVSQHSVCLSVCICICTAFVQQFIYVLCCAFGVVTHFG